MADFETPPISPSRSTQGGTTYLGNSGLVSLVNVPCSIRSIAGESLHADSMPDCGGPTTSQCNGACPRCSPLTNCRAPVVTQHSSEKRWPDCFARNQGCAAEMFRGMELRHSVESLHMPHFPRGSSFRATHSGFHFVVSLLSPGRYFTIGHARRHWRLFPEQSPRASRMNVLNTYAHVVL